MTTQSILNSIGAIFITSGLTSWWGVYLTRVEANRALEGNLALFGNIIKMGIKSAKFWGVDIPANAKEVDILVVRAQGWISQRVDHQFPNLVKLPDATLRICLVHPNSNAIPLLASKFNESPAKTVSKIVESIVAVIETTEKLRKKQDTCTIAHVIIHGHKLYPTHSYYRFDDLAHAVYYTMRKDKLPVPSLQLEKGEFGEFFTADFKDIWDNQSELIYDSRRTEAENCSSLDKFTLSKEQKKICRIFPHCK